MSNHHLRNKDLFLKAKGLLSQMLSLPENWDYTLKGVPLATYFRNKGQVITLDSFLVVCLEPALLFSL